MKRLFIPSLVVGFLSLAAAVAQVTPPLVSSMNQNDLVQVVPRGAAQAQNYYATPGQIAGVEQYSYQVPLTAFSITPANMTALLYLNPAGTLATGTVTMQAQPSDGQKFCLMSTQTQTAITISANTGQTLSAGTFGLATPTALVANTRYCWLYIGPLASWTRTI